MLARVSLALALIYFRYVLLALLDFFFCIHIVSIKQAFVAVREGC